MDGSCEEAKDEAGVCNKETKRSTTTQTDVLHNKEAEASQKDLKGVP